MRPRLLPHAPPPLPSPRRSRLPPLPPAANRWRARPQRRQPLRTRRGEHGGCARRCALIRQVTLIRQAYPTATRLSSALIRQVTLIRQAYPTATRLFSALIRQVTLIRQAYPTATRLSSALGCQQARLLLPGALGLRARPVRQAQGGDGHGAWSMGLPTTQHRRRRVPMKTRRARSPSPLSTALTLSHPPTAAAPCHSHSQAPAPCHSRPL